LDATYNDYHPMDYWEIANIVTPLFRYFACPSCEEIYVVRPIRLNYHWHYRGACPVCVQPNTLKKEPVTWSNLYRIKTYCPRCETESFVHPGNRFGACVECGKGLAPSADREAVTGMEDE
jgi:hypothetical protein